MNRYQELFDLLTGLEGDFDKFYNKKNQAAGTRIRKGMQEMKNFAQSTRLEVQEMKNATKEADAVKEAAAKK